MWLAKKILTPKNLKKLFDKTNNEDHVLLLRDVMFIDKLDPLRFSPLFLAITILSGWLVIFVSMAIGLLAYIVAISYIVYRAVLFNTELARFHDRWIKDLDLEKG